MQTSKQTPDKNGLPTGEAVQPRAANPVTPTWGNPKERIEDCASRIPARYREILRDIAEDGTRPAMVRLRAIEIDAKLAGHFAPDQVVVETAPKTLDAVRERAKNMASAMSLVRTECEAG